jgi:predicted nuclease with TOPRIM domain
MTAANRDTLAFIQTLYTKARDGGYDTLWRAAKELEALIEAEEKLSSEMFEYKLQINRLSVNVLYLNSKGGNKVSPNENAVSNLQMAAEELTKLIEVLKIKGIIDCQGNTVSLSYIVDIIEQSACNKKER